MRHAWDDAKERVDARKRTDEGKKIYARRKETVERSFADAKQLYGIVIPARAEWRRYASNGCWPLPRRT